MPAATLVLGIVLTLGPHASTASLFQAKPAMPAPAPTAKQPPEKLDRLLAPIALYPDQLLTQMLLSSGDAAKIQEMSGWLVRNADLTGTALQRAAEAADFAPSLVVLTMFPQVVNYMADNIDWTKELGLVFAADREGVLDSIQRLRAEATKSGALKSTPQQTVTTKTTTTGEQAIVIEPANPQVVYVPQYNPQVVYAQPTTTHTTVVVKEEDNSAEAAAAGAIVGFAAGIAIGAAFDNDYYHGPYGWYGGGYMYNDAWDDFYDDREDAREDFYDHREDAREDWQDHREDLADERGDRAENARESRGERSTTASQNAEQRRTDRASGTTSQQRTEAQQNRQATRAEGGTSAGAQRASGASANTASATSSSTKGRSSGDRQSVSQRSGGSDAFSGYSSGRSERSASSRGSSSRASSGRSRSGGGGRRR